MDFHERVHFSRQYNGCEIQTPEGAVIPASQELQIGQQVLCWGDLATVDSPTTATSTSSIWFLKQGGDDRESWVCWGGANLRGIAKVKNPT